MNVFKTILGFIKGFKARLNKKRRDKRTIGKIESIGQRNTQEIDKELKEKIQEIIINPDESKEFTKEVEKLLQTKTLIELREYVSNLSVKKQKIFSESELEEEILQLNSKSFNLEIKQNQIRRIQTNFNQDTDVKVKRLSAFLKERKEKISVQRPSNPFVNQFDSIFTKDFSLTQRFSIREKEKRRIEEIHKGQLKSRLSKLETLIGQNNLEEAKILINTLDFALKVTTYQNLKERLKRAKSKYEEQKLKEFEKKQAEILRAQRELAEKERLAQEAIKEQERIRQIQLSEQRKQAEEKVQQKERELQLLLRKKSNWNEFATLLNQHNITTFYHFTDKANINSIIKHGGLFSWKYMDKEGIVVPYPGSGPTARQEAIQFGLTDFVSVSFASDLPMKHVAIRDGRIKNPVTLKISLDVAYFENSLFTTMNAADNRTIKGGSIENLRMLKFHLYNRHYFHLEGDDKKYYQSEVLVKTWIPIEYITNINDF
jgi:hypothetical protein